jgi:hypothetical protein
VALESGGRVLVAMNRAEDSTPAAWTLPQDANNLLLHVAGHEMQFASEYPIIEFARFCKENKVIVGSGRFETQDIPLQSAVEIWDVSSNARADPGKKIKVDGVLFIDADAECARVLASTPNTDLRIWNLSSHSLPTDPNEFWKRAQLSLGRTIDENDKVVDLDALPTAATGKGDIPHCQP